MDENHFFSNGKRPPGSQLRAGGYSAFVLGPPDLIPLPVDQGLSSVVESNI